MLLRSLPQRGFRIEYLKQQSKRSSSGYFAKLHVLSLRFPNHSSNANIKVFASKLRGNACYLQHILTIELDIRFIFLKC